MKDDQRYYILSLEKPNYNKHEPEVIGEYPDIPASNN